MYQFVNYRSEAPSTDGCLPAPQKYDYQIKCQPGCCIFNSQSCLLIPPHYLPDLSPPKTETNQHADYFVTYLFLSLVPPPPPFLLLQLPLLLTQLSAHYQSSPLTIPKWRETYLPRGMSECLPKITLIPNSLLKYLKKTVDEVTGKYKTALIPPLMEWQTVREEEPNFCRRRSRAGATHTK